MAIALAQRSDLRQIPRRPDDAPRDSERRPCATGAPRTLRDSQRERRGVVAANRMLVEDRSQRRACGREFHAHADVRCARHRPGQGRRRRVGARAVGAPSGAVRHRRRRALPRHSERSARGSSSTSTRCVCSGRSSSARRSRCRDCRSATACRTRCREARRCRDAKRNTRSYRCPFACCRWCRRGRPISATRPAETFGDVDARLFRSNLLLIVAGVAFVLAGLMAVTLLARAAVKRHAMTPARQRPMSSGAVLRAASRELGAVQSESQKRGMERRAGGPCGGGTTPCGSGGLCRARSVTRKSIAAPADRRAGRRRSGPRHIAWQKGGAVRFDHARHNRTERQIGFSVRVMALAQRGAGRIFGRALQPGRRRRRHGARCGAL